MQTNDFQEVDVNSYQFGYRNAVRLQDKLLDQRAPHASHDWHLRTRYDYKDDAEFRLLLENVFGHHETTRFKASQEECIDWKSGDCCTSYFHHQGDFFQKIDVMIGLAPGNPSLTYDELFLRWSKSGSLSDHNEIAFLVGNIGIGKTTFLCNYMCKMYDAYRNAGLVPVRINLDTACSHEIRPISDIIRYIKEAILSTLVDNDEISLSDRNRLQEESAVAEDQSPERVANSFAHLLSRIDHYHSIRIALFIDNIDFLYHLGDRGFFAINGDLHPDREEVREAHDTILKIISVFWRDTNFSASKLGMPVVLSTRKDTLSFLLARHTEVPVKGIEENTYSIAQPTQDLARRVISKRFDLAVELAEGIAETAKRQEVVSQCRELKRRYTDNSLQTRSGRRLFQDLWFISRSGLRDMIDQISRYSWLEFNESRRAKSLNERFTRQYFPSILAYALDGQRKYSQLTGNIPNLFLINTRASNHDFGVPKEFKDGHIYSLWLKKLIIQYILARRGMKVDTDSIIDVFCGSNRRGYSENLVRYSLSSLFEVPTAELISVDVASDGSAGGRPFVRNISVTDRGKFLVQDFSDTFVYLQLVVEDNRMIFPKSLAGLFPYEEPDYGYLFGDAEEYRDAVRAVVKNKGRQCTFFAILLEEVLRCEQQLYPNVFRRLMEEGVALSVEGAIVDKVASGASAIANALHFQEEISFAQTEEKRRMRAIVREKVKEVFDPCFKFHEHHFS